MATSNQLRRYGPVAAIAVVVVAVIVIVVAVGGDDDTAEGPGPDEVSGGLTVVTEWGEEITLPEGVIPFSVAEELDIEVDWPESCDTDRGTAAVPTFFAPECFAPFDGDNGGATATGVTEDTITVVLYQSMEDDPILEAVAGAVTQDRPSEVSQTFQDFLPYFQEYYETYGREVELVVFEGSGNALDEVAARADAVEIAQEIEPFAVWGGPLLTSAFQDELAAQGVLHIGLAGGGHQPDYYEEHDPYLIQVGMGARQTRQHLAEYIGKRLAGDPAVHAGDPAMHDTERVFGMVHIETGPESAELAENFEEFLADHDVDLAATASYQNPLDVSAEAPGIIARMKDAGVTSLILIGDPLTPATFTRTATEQDYFPEWIVSGIGLVDSTIYARTYDQDQWANAFGITIGAVRQDPAITGSVQLFRWYTCTDPIAFDYTPLVYPMPALFFAALQGVGPDLTPENFRQALFNANPTPRGISNPSLSWGEPVKGRWDAVDYQGVDDATELWWNPEAVGPDESDQEGPGMYMFVDGGARYLWGEWPETPPTVFEAADAVDILEEAPAEEAYPDYPSPCE